MGVFFFFAAIYTFILGWGSWDRYMNGLTLGDMESSPGVVGLIIWWIYTASLWAVGIYLAVYG